MPTPIETLNAALTWQHFDIIDSTNNYLLDAGQPVNQLVSANKQTKGRGRRQKNWVDEGNSLLFSLSTAFNPTMDMSAWPIQVAITLAQHLNTLTPTPILIKWPNDLYLFNQEQQWGKCCGILIESSMGQQGKMVTGIGINLSPMPHIEADYPIAHVPLSMDKETLLIQLANQLFLAWEQFIISPQVNPILFMPMDFLKGKTFSAIDTYTQQSHRGLGIGINAQGHYQLQQDTQIITLSSQQHIRDIV